VSDQTEFTKERAQVARECVDAIFRALPRTKAAGLLGELNDVFLFIAAAERAAPAQVKATT